MGLELSPEIWIRIFELLNKQDLARISIVDRQFMELAKPLLYQTASPNFNWDFTGQILNDEYDPDEDEFEGAPNQLQSILNNRTLAQHVKTFYAGAEDCDQPCIPSIVRSNLGNLVFENLMTLKLKATYPSAKYILEKNKDFYSNLFLSVGGCSTLLFFDAGTVEHLYLHGATYSLDAMDTLPEFLQNQIVLRSSKNSQAPLDKITFNNCTMGPDFCRVLDQCIPMLSKLHLRSFVLEDGLESVPDCQISDSLVASLLAIPTLEELRILGVMDLSPTFLHGATQHLSKLVAFELLTYEYENEDYVTGLMDSVHTVLQNNSKLKKLSISVQDVNNFELDPTFYDTNTFQHVKNSLQYLRLRCGYVDPEKIYPVLQSLPSLKHVRLQKRRDASPNPAQLDPSLEILSKLPNIQTCEFN